MTEQKTSKTAAQAARKAADETAVIEKIAAMPEQWRGIAERLHKLIVRSVPALDPKTWYGMPGYALNGKVVCFFRADAKYMTFGFTQEADLSVDDGAPDRLIESAWYLTALDDATEARLGAILRRALKGEQL